MREEWYVVPAQVALRLSSQPDTSDHEPQMLLVHPDRLGLEQPRKKLSRRAHGRSIKQEVRRIGLWKLAAMATAAGASWRHPRGEDLDIDAVGTDTRSLPDGCTFVALPGENLD